MKESQTTPRIDTPLLLKRKALLLDINFWILSHLLYFPRWRFTLLPVSLSSLSTSLLARAIACEGSWELKDPRGSGRPSLTWK